MDIVVERAVPSVREYLVCIAVVSELPTTYNIGQAPGTS